MAIDFGPVCPLLQVFDMPTSIAFYRDKLGFELVDGNGEGDDIDWALMRNAHAWLMLNTAYERDERPPAPEPARVAAHRDTGLFIDAVDLDALHAHLRAQGVVTDPPKTAPYGMRQLYLTDPDGYELCFQHPAKDPA